MQVKAIIFDMDGLLIDSEPLWQEAGKETLLEYGKTLSAEQYHSSTGLRTEEWIEHWFHFFNISMKHAPAAIDTIVNKAIQKIDERGIVFPGSTEAVQFVKQQNLLSGLATSSPLSLVDVVIRKLNMQQPFDAITSAEKLPFGKPHPEVYMNCAVALQVSPLHCVAIEDSFNGMIAAKAAKMKCIVVPAPTDYDHPKWNAADAKLKSLQELNEDLLNSI
jgi:mannitol-1-/sugar-/sorbitol-6-/2-deoxyglucose-6-phosphatase